MPLLIVGEFADRDDFNYEPVPHNFTRRTGGACYATTYRPGASYLLLLKKIEGRLTPYWSALSRSNDQIRPDGDPWVDWVRRRVRVRKRP